MTLRPYRCLALLGALALAGCGRQQHLMPAPGHTLPQKPETAPAAPNADQLMASPPNYRPGRSDELLTKSATRPDDRFDLPPH